jgi:hypothetical protein
VSPYEKQVQDARDNVVRWVRWIRDNYSADFPTDEALAKAVGYTKGGLSQIISRESRRVPHLRMLIAMSEITGFSVTQILKTDPPNMTRRGK